MIILGCFGVPPFKETPVYFYPTKVVVTEIPTVALLVLSDHPTPTHMLRANFPVWAAQEISQVLESFGLQGVVELKFGNDENMMNMIYSIC